MDEIRASDAEREVAVTRLRDAAAEGRLDFEELAERLEAAQRAVRRGDLARLLADLPAALAEPAASVAPAGTAPSPPAPTAVREASHVFGDIRLGGRWSVPAQSRWRTVFGSVRLDLRQAVVDAPEIAIDIRTTFGDVDLLVPDGVLVEVRSRTAFGGVRQEAGGVAPPGAPRIVLTGRTVFGNVRVRSQRPHERLLGLLRGPA